MEREQQLKAEREREQILVAIALALESPEEVLAIFAESEDADAAQVALRSRWQLAPVQAMAIADMQFRRTSQLERQRVLDELLDRRRNIERLAATE